MKQKLLIAVALFLILSSLLIYLKFARPSDEIVKREYREMHPNAEVVSVELIFDWEPESLYTYAVKYRGSSPDEILTDESSIRQNWNFSGSGAVTRP